MCACIYLYVYYTYEMFLFSEREENVKADIFHAYIVLLKQTRPAVSSSDPDRMEEEGGWVHCLSPALKIYLYNLNCIINIAFE